MRHRSNLGGQFDHTSACDLLALRVRIASRFVQSFFQPRWHIPVIPRSSRPVIHIRALFRQDWESARVSLLLARYDGLLTSVVSDEHPGAEAVHDAVFDQLMRTAPTEVYTERTEMTTEPARVQVSGGPGEVRRGWDADGGLGMGLVGEEIVFLIQLMG